MSNNPEHASVQHSLSNMTEAGVSLADLTCRQAQRYRVKRAFQEAKSDIGTGYQVRKWTARHHHMALVMLAHSLSRQRTTRSSRRASLVECDRYPPHAHRQDPRRRPLIDKRMAQMERRPAPRRKDIERHPKRAQAG
ncbi:hypothetical protein [Halochromatium glycolicum]|jgi:hypothetical protein|uniref:hypothetical protein n=1 Tax=Halochromatium glycolicum TaxID=85075 RepID=UPI00190E5BA5|nr:hypothetical protein [Halochromatium glycolicum]